MSIQLKRAYEAPEESDGYRVLVDRLWPRGVSKEDLQLDEWMKGIAPSAELRKWFDHDPDKFEAFTYRYREELKDRGEQVAELMSRLREHGTITMVYAAKDRRHNHARVLKEYLSAHAEST